MSIPRASIWPNVVFDTTSAKGMASAEAWLTSVTPVSPVEPREAPNSTQGPETPNPSTQAAVNFVARNQPNGSIGLLEAALAEARSASRPLPPPEPGTHESETRFSRCVGAVPGRVYCEYVAARSWSKRNATAAARHA